MAGKWTTGRSVRRRINALDPIADDEEILRLNSDLLYADPYFAHSTFLVTFARQAAVPAIAKVLCRSGNGDVIVDPRRRNNDTIVFFMEFLRRGYRSDEGKAAIARMERIHEQFLISDELKVYTLATVMLEPRRLSAQFGCTPFSDLEDDARWNYWRGFAAQMPLELPAENWQDFLAWTEDYERRTYAFTDDGAAIFDALVRDWSRWYPDAMPGRDKFARQTLAALLDEPTRRALGVSRPPRSVELQVSLIARTYLLTTPIRVFRRNRTLTNYFGRELEDPRDLENVGHQARRHTSKTRSS